MSAESLRRPSIENHSILASSSNYATPQATSVDSHLGDSDQGVEVNELLTLLSSIGNSR